MPDGWTSERPSSPDRRGIGAEVACRLAAEGAAIVVSGRSTDEGEAVAAGIRDSGGDARFVPADMRDPDDIRDFVDATANIYGSVDVVANNAAVQTETAFQEATMEDWSFVLETDSRAYWLTVKYALDHIPARGRRERLLELRPPDDAGPLPVQRGQGGR